MSNEDIQYLVTIDTRTNLSNPTINLVDGVIQWTPYGYDSISPIDGLFSQRWITQHGRFYPFWWIRLAGEFVGGKETATSMIYQIHFIMPPTR